MKKHTKIRLGRPPTVGATTRDIFLGRLKQALGKILNHSNLPGFVKPIDYYDDLTKTHITVSIGGLFTVISINGRDYYFRRLDGKFDGTGIIYGCSDYPTL